MGLTETNCLWTPAARGGGRCLIGPRGRTGGWTRWTFFGLILNSFSSILRVDSSLGHHSQQWIPKPSQWVAPSTICPWAQTCPAICNILEFHGLNMQWKGPLKGEQFGTHYTDAAILCIYSSSGVWGTPFWVNMFPLAGHAWTDCREVVDFPLL